MHKTINNSCGVNKLIRGSGVEYHCQLNNLLPCRGRCCFRNNSSFRTYFSAKIFCLSYCNCVVLITVHNCVSILVIFKRERERNMLLPQFPCKWKLWKQDQWGCNVMCADNIQDFIFRIGRHSCFFKWVNVGHNLCDFQVSLSMNVKTEQCQ